MKRHIGYKMANGETITVKVDEPEPVGVEPVRPPYNINIHRDWSKLQPAQVTFEEVLDKVTPATTIIINKLSSIGLEKIEVGLGFKMNASAGVEANYKITLTWEKGGG